MTRPRAARPDGAATSRPQQPSSVDNGGSPLPNRRRPAARWRSARRKLPYLGVSKRESAWKRLQPTPLPDTPRPHAKTSPHHPRPDNRTLFEEALKDWRRVMDVWALPSGEFWETK